jgi:hypothetical protein
MSGEPCILVEVVFRSLAECGRWYPPRPPWDGVHTCLLLACVEGTSPTLVRIVEGPRLAPGEPGRFVLAPYAPLGDGSALQPGVRFSLLDVKFSASIGTGRVLERLPRTVTPLDQADRRETETPRKLYGPPVRLRIPRGEGRFVNVGRQPNGTQLLAYVCGVFPDDYRVSMDDWQTKKRWQAVLHQFDRDGRHLHTEVRLGGLEIDPDHTARAFGHLNAMHDELAAEGELDFDDIWVQLFSVQIEGIRYGLCYECRRSEDDGEEYESVTLLPWGITFGPPWDSGGYST